MILWKARNEQQQHQLNKQLILNIKLQFFANKLDKK